MKNTINIEQFGFIISDQMTGKDIFKAIKEVLETDEKCIVDFSNVKSMASFNAKQIFGKLYMDLGEEDFFNKIEIRNTTADIRMIITLGIQSEIADNQ